jgi:transcriptional regulator with XRE-family HTH domain
MLDNGELAGLTQQQKAEKLGISPQYLCDLQRGRRRLSARLAAKLERFGNPGGTLYLLQAEEDMHDARSALNMEGADS